MKERYQMTTTSGSKANNSVNPLDGRILSDLRDYIDTLIALSNNVQCAIARAKYHGCVDHTFIRIGVETLTTIKARHDKLVLEKNLQAEKATLPK